MDSLIAGFLSLPNIVIYAIFGALGGAFGGLLGKVLGKVFKNEKLTMILSIVCIIIAVQIPQHLMREVEKEKAPNDVVEKLKEQRLFALIFRLHPEAEEEFRVKVAEVVKAPINEQHQRMQSASSEIVGKYYAMHLDKASDQMVRKLIQKNAASMERFKSQPVQCVAYFVGRPQFGKDDINQDFVIEELNLKADIIESSETNPSVLTNPGTLEEVAGMIAEAYTKNGYDVNELAKFDFISTLPPEEGCKVAVNFSKVLASMDEERGVYVFKSLMSISKQQK